MASNGNGGSTSYPCDKAGPIKGGNMSLGVSNHNFNVAPFDDNPPVHNDSPAVRKSFSWNRGEAGNAK